jgi:hypothetical protein
MTEKIEKKCNALNKEVEDHEQFVLLNNLFFRILKIILFFRRIKNAVIQKLDEAKNDVTIPSLTSIA